jgi:mannose-6-phosphate isomerase-like protein (cupin superfamily)
MVIKIDKPAIVKSEGNKPKVIEEYIGRVNTDTQNVSIARMKSPSGWQEPGQKPEFDEYTVVLKGMLRLKTKAQVFDIYAGQAVIVKANEWIQYSSPDSQGAEYIAVCMPAFSPETVCRDWEKK